MLTQHNTAGFSCNLDVLPIYIGDDTTDEDAFKVIRLLLSLKFMHQFTFSFYKHCLLIFQVLQLGNRGYGILVSAVPKETNAFFSLRDPSEVKIWSLSCAFLHCFSFKFLEFFDSQPSLTNAKLCQGQGIPGVFGEHEATAASLKMISEWLSDVFIVHLFYLGLDVTWISLWIFF